MIPALLLFGLAAANAYPQSPAGAAHGFEVASIKMCRDGDSVGETDSPGRLHLACVTTANLIRLAYLVFPSGKPNTPVSPTVFQMPIPGVPSWLDAVRYRIDAETEQRANIEMMKGPMLQRLLEDRFKLKLHREARQVDVFELAVARGSPHFEPAKAGGCVVFDRNNPPPKPPPGEQPPALCGSLRDSPKGGFDITGVTIAGLCRQLSAYVDREIVDKTGISGTFDVHLDLTRADLFYPGAAPDPLSPFTPGDGGAIASAVRKLGLQMRPGKGSAQFLVIDHVERPVEN